MLDLRSCQDQLEDLIRDTVLLGLGRRAASVPDVTSLRAFVTQGETGTALDDDSLAVIVVGGVATASYRFSKESTAADDGSAVVKPLDVLGSGRWLRWTSTTRLAPVKGGNSHYLHELLDGPLERVIVLDKSMEASELSALVHGQIPSVLIEAVDDNPVDLTFATGHRYDTKYAFTVSVIDQNLRDRRQSTHGWPPDDADKLSQGGFGANAIDGLVKALLAGVNLCAAESGIRNVQIGRGVNWFSADAQRRVIRSRSFTFQVTEEYPPAPNDSLAAQQVNAQAEMATLGENPPPFDTQNFVSAGITVPIGDGLTKSVAPGTALIAGSPVSYAGQSKTFSANSDTYRDLLPNGTLAFTVVGAGDPEPPVAATAMRVGVTRTDSTQVLVDAFLARALIPYGSNNQIPLM
jgi:hypothetical protein